ncbi:MAG TPA: hypothetical protein VGA36_06580 [Nitriliruptorales bacterium]
MDAISEAIATVTDSLGIAGATTAVIGLIVLTVLLVTLIVARRREEGGPPDEPPATLDAPTVGTIRRPVYTDPLLLDDLLAHAETRDYGRSLRDTLDDESAATAETRKLNKVLAGLQQRRMLVDLDERADAPIAKGSAITVTGTLEELPASAVAELLELSTPVLVHSAASAGGGNGDRARADHEVPEVLWGPGPKVFALTPRDGDRRFLLVLHPDGARDAVRRPLTAGQATVLGVTEDVLGRRDRLHVDDYLTPYLSRDVQERVRDSNLGDAAESVASLAGHKIRRGDLSFEGPGARLSVAAIYR